MTQRPGAISPADSLDQTCDAAAAQAFVGKVATAEVVEQARAAAGARTARTLAPGQMVTMDYRAGRLNLDVDDGNVITGVRCG